MFNGPPVNLLLVTEEKSERPIIHKLRPEAFPNWILMIGNWRSADIIHRGLLELNQQLGPLPEFEGLAEEDFVLLAIAIQNRLRLGSFEPVDFPLAHQVAELKGGKGFVGRIPRDIESTS
jgi:hypothetical protein